MLAGIVLLEDAPIQLVHCFNQAKGCKTALPDPVIDSLSVLKYEQHMMCLQEHICALQLPFHHPVPPGWEKFMMEVDRETLVQMYSEDLETPRADVAKTIVLFHESAFQANDNAHDTKMLIMRSSTLSTLFCFVSDSVDNLSRFLIVLKTISTTN